MELSILIVVIAVFLVLGNIKPKPKAGNKSRRDNIVTIIDGNGNRRRALLLDQPKAKKKTGYWRALLP